MLKSLYYNLYSTCTPIEAKLIQITLSVVDYILYYAHPERMKISLMFKKHLAGQNMIIEKTKRCSMP